MVGAMSAAETRSGSPGCTALPNARTKPSGARSWVPLSCGSPTRRSSTRFTGFSGSMPWLDTSSTRSPGCSVACSRPIAASSTA